jgi:glycosyltransferase involved in cell wall biosynthesis
VHLVASGGTSSPGLPLTCLFLDQSELVCLLHASSIVVTMSQFAEGWCRIAHEAMLCGTPVIGSGSGGMRELLQSGGQGVCEAIEDLKPTVKRLLGDERRRAEQGRAGQVFARHFTYERFQRAWVLLVTRMCAIGDKQISAKISHEASQSTIVG